MERGNYPGETDGISLTRVVLFCFIRPENKKRMHLTPSTCQVSTCFCHCATIKSSQIQKETAEMKNGGKQQNWARKAFIGAVWEALWAEENKFLQKGGTIYDRFRFSRDVKAGRVSGSGNSQERSRGAANTAHWAISFQLNHSYYIRRKWEDGGVVGGRESRARLSLSVLPRPEINGCGWRKEEWWLKEVTGRKKGTEKNRKQPGEG